MIDNEIDIALGSLELLSALRDEDRLRFAAKAQLVEVAPNRILVKVGTVASEVYFVLKGSMKVSTVGRDGKEAIIALLQPGAHIGLVSLLSQISRTTDCVATTRTQLLKIDGDFFLAEIKRLPALSFELMRSLAVRLEQTSRHFTELAILSLPHRLFARLYELADSVPFDDGEQLIVRERPVHQELASMLGVTREAITRTLKLLEDEGNIVVSEDQIFIVSVPRP